MKKIWKRVCTGLLALTTILTALPITSVQAAETQYWTESSERVGYIEHVMNDGTIYSTFNEGHMRVEGETAYCVDINTGFKNGYKTRHDASASMSAAQIEDVALSLEYVKQYRGSHSNLNANQGYLLEQCVVWQRFSEQLGWKCDNVRAAYSEISQDIQNEVYAGARAFVHANKGRYKCGGYIYTGEGQDGFRVLLTFADESTKTQQHAGFTTKREANAFRDEVIGQLHTGTYIVYGKIRVEEFMIFWLEDIMRPRITDDTYTTYKSAIKNYIVPQIGKMYMSTINQGYIRKLYNAVAEKYESVAKNVRTIMKTSLEYAFNKNVLATNPANGINLPKKIKKTEYRVLKIDEKKTLTLPQVLRLIEASKETPIHMQILFAVLMGLRRSEINGLKYSDVDYIHRTLRVERQLGKKPNSKAEDCAPKMLTKQEIKTKTPAGVRELPIPDYVFEAILEERKTYEKNRRRRPKEFRDWNYICCSTYGNPRSKGFHQKYYKDLLKSLDLPDIHFHQLRNTYATILLKNSFNSKGVSHLLGHAKEIISVDVYGDTQEIIEDCLDILEPFIEEVIPKERKDQYYDYSEVIEIDLILEEYFNAA